MAARTKAPGGVVTRHSRKCNTRQAPPTGSCNCAPTYWGWVWSQAEKKKLWRSYRGDLSAARSWVADADKQLRQGTLGTVSRDTLEQAAAAWIEQARAGEVHARGGRPYKPSVIRSYEVSLRLHVLPVLGSYKLAQLTTPDLQRFVNKLVASKTKPSTIRNAINPLRAIYRDAIADGTVTINPCLGLRLPSVDAVRDRVADPVEAGMLLDALPEGDRALWATAFYAGLRRGELRALRCRNVDIKAGMISVEAGWDDVDGPIDPKSKQGTRTTPIPARLSKLLAAHLLKTGRSGDDFVFGTTKTRPFTPTHMRRRALKAWADENAKRAERNEPLLEPIAFHSCRHTYVSLMYAAGVPLETIGDYVGHSSTYMTDKYRHLLPGSHDDARKKLDALLAAAKI